MRCFLIDSSDNIFANAHALFDSSVMGSATRLFAVKKQITSRFRRTIVFGEPHPSRPYGVALPREDYCLPDELALSVKRHLPGAIPVPRLPFHTKNCLLRKSSSI